MRLDFLALPLWQVMIENMIFAVLLFDYDNDKA